MKAGQDFGQFNFGSTIVLIFEAPRNSTFDMKANQKIKYGQLMARIEPPRLQSTTKENKRTTATKLKETISKTEPIVNPAAAPND